MQQQLYSLQYLRACASLAVVLFHSKDLFLQLGLPDWWGFIFKFGFIGVDLFFVLSGFVMVYTTSNSSSPLEFLLKRLIRIFAGYWPILAIFVVIKIVFVDMEKFVPGNLDILGSALLYNPDPSEIIIYPAWSLAFELLFYFSFFILLASKINLLTFWVIWLLGVSFLTATQLSWVEQYFFSEALLYEFPLGVALGHLFKRSGIHVKYFWITLITSLTIFTVYGFGVVEFPEESRGAVLGPASFLMIYALLCLEVAQRVPHVRWLNLLGGASYSLYLWHIPIFFSVTFMGFKTYIVSTNNPWLWCGLILGFLVLLSVVWHVYIERELIRFARIQMKRFI